MIKIVLRPSGSVRAPRLHPGDVYAAGRLQPAGGGVQEESEQHVDPEAGRKESGRGNLPRQPTGADQKVVPRLQDAVQPRAR